MHESYAIALTNAIASGTDEAKAVDALIATLKADGRLKLLPGIVRELKKIEAKKSVLAPAVEVAHKSDEADALKEAAALGITAAHAKVNHDLVSGWRATAKGKLIDRSGKRMLTDIYQNVVVGK